jgi:hypothetical protein
MGRAFLRDMVALEHNNLLEVFREHTCSDQARDTAADNNRALA